MGETYVIYNYHIYCSIYRIYIYTCVFVWERGQRAWHKSFQSVYVCTYELKASLCLSLTNGGLHGTTLT